MTFIKRLAKLFATFVVPVEPGPFVDTMAYHSIGDEHELRFSPRNVLRRHY